jgi:hypothetical protein
VVGTVVGTGVVLVVLVGLGATVSVGAVAATSAMTRVEPNGVRARAIETTRASVTAGYATTARARTWRALSLFKLFNFLTP